ncbi:hypothetical protein [Cupriavidus sp. CuC1]|uniref:hypothetical protein n=1 Tax=Cupriavidus sp. CuC1 TaxID=3373131 RepID=UPI0037D241DE
MAIDGAGNAIAVWQEQNGVGAYGGANRYAAGTGWGLPGKFSGTVPGDVYAPRVAVGADGNATASWYQWEASGINFRTNRYLTGSGWDVPPTCSARHDSVQPRYLPVANRFAGYSLFVLRKNVDPKGSSLGCAVAIADHPLALGRRPSLHHAEAIPGENRPLADAERGIYCKQPGNPY